MVLHVEPAQPGDEAAQSDSQSDLDAEADAAAAVNRAGKPAPFDFSAPAPFASSGALRNPFPPIADYAFLSDCETTCLIAPSGAVEWMCVPRPDSPSCSAPSWTAAPAPSGSVPYDVIGARRPALPAGQPDGGDHLADPHRLAHRARRLVHGSLAQHRRPVPDPPSLPRRTSTPSTACCARSLRERDGRPGHVVRAGRSTTAGSSRVTGSTTARATAQVVASRRRRRRQRCG